jgi:hypothetical protein
MKVYEGGVVTSCKVCGETRVSYTDLVYLSDGSCYKHDDVLCRCEREKNEEMFKRSTPFFEWVEWMQT